MKTMKLKINRVPGYSDQVTVKTDGFGVPLDKFWRNRLKDAEIDNCVELIKPIARKSRKESAE